jgi:hypothetical protein
VKKTKQPPKSTDVSLVRSSAAEYLTFVAASGQGGVEAVYADESIWVTQKMMGKVTAEIAKAHAMSEFEKYRIVQDRLFESDFDRLLKQIESGDTPDTDED